MIIPFFSAILLSYLLVGWPDYTIGGVVDKVASTIRRPDMGLWFLWVLFFLNVILVVCRKIAARIKVDERIVVLITIVVLNLIELITRFEQYGYHWIAWYLMFFSMGVYWKGFEELGGISPKLERSLLWGSLILFPVLVSFFRMHNQSPIFYQWIDLGGYFPIFYRIICGVIGVILFFELFKQFRIGTKPLRCMGGATLGIYYIHFFLLNYITKNVDDSILPRWVLIILIWFVVTAGSYLFTILCEKNKFTRLLVLGDNSKKK